MHPPPGQTAVHSRHQYGQCSCAACYSRLQLDMYDRRTALMTDARVIWVRVKGEGGKRGPLVDAIKGQFVLVTAGP